MARACHKWLQYLLTYENIFISKYNLEKTQHFWIFKCGEYIRALANSAFTLLCFRMRLPYKIIITSIKYIFKFDININNNLVKTL